MKNSVSIVRCGERTLVKRGASNSSMRRAERLTGVLNTLRFKRRIDYALSGMFTVVLAQLLIDPTMSPGERFVCAVFSFVLNLGIWGFCVVCLRAYVGRLVARARREYLPVIRLECDGNRAYAYLKVDASSRSVIVPAPLPDPTTRQPTYARLLDAKLVRTRSGTYRVEHGEAQYYG